MGVSVHVSICDPMNVAAADQKNPLSRGRFDTIRELTVRACSSSNAIVGKERWVCGRIACWNKGGRARQPGIVRKA